MKIKPKQLKQIMEQLGKEAFPDDLDHWTQIQKRLNREIALVTQRRPQRYRLVAGIGAALVLVGLIIALTPAGQALAQALRDFFKIVSVEEIPLPPEEQRATPTYAPTFSAVIAPAASPEPMETPIPMPTGTNDPALAPCYTDINSYACKIAHAEKRAGFDAKEFPAEPKGFAFSGVYASPGEISMGYDWISGGAYLNLNQGIRDEFPDFMGAVQEDAIEEVVVGENRGQYVVGMYVYKGDPLEVAWVESARFRLRWMEGDHWYEIDVAGDIGPDFPYNDRDYLIEMAENLVSQPEPQQGPRADNLTNMEDAAHLARFTPLEPGILPEGFYFDHGEYDVETFTLQLEYTPGEQGIAIVSVWETPADKAHLSPELGEIPFEGEEVEINGYTGMYYSRDPYSHIVIWRTDELRILVNVYSSEMWYGGSFTKEQILEIARSVQ